MSFDEFLDRYMEDDYESQSLSNRAMSFDVATGVLAVLAAKVSIPFEQGDVFRR